MDLVNDAHVAAASGYVVTLGILSLGGACNVTKHGLIVGMVVPLLIFQRSL